MTREFAVVGGGNMARAIVAGAVASGRFAAEAFTIADPNAEKRAPYAEMGVATVEHASALREPLERGATLLVAVKPQMLTAAAADVPIVGRRVLVCSILGGATIDIVAGALTGPLGAPPAVVRVMPNTPAQVGAGMSALAVGTGVTEEEAELIDELFRSVGETVRLDEPQIDAFSAVIGSGPAYVFLFAECLERGAHAMGLPEAAVRGMVTQLLMGSAQLLTASAPEDPAVLRHAVTSKGGSTAAALAVFEEASYADVVVRALEAARHRSVELAEEAAS
ncbi:MAG: pyrroline-5-carboxylate reductase [Planctomycetota bacterium]